MKNLTLVLCLCVLLPTVIVAAKASSKAAAKNEIVDETATQTKSKTKEAKQECSKYNKYEAETHVKRCLAGWSRYKNEKCLKVNMVDAVTHDEAEAACQLMGSSLASVVTDSERNFIRSLILRDTLDETTLTSVWIGLRRKFGQLFWYDLSEWSETSGLNTLPWATNEPSTLAGADCASLATSHDILVNSTTDFGKLTMADCVELKGFICQKFITEKCGCSS